MKPRDDEQVADWLRHGDADWRVAQLVAPHGLHDAAAFHCQQAAEKWLKALIVALDGRPERTHDIGRLLAQLAELGSSRARLADAAATLTPFATLSRYPGFGDLDAEQVGEALAAARRVRAEVDAAFGSPGSP